MNCKYCEEKITKENTFTNKTLNVNYKSVCSNCYKSRLKEYNDRKWKRIREAKWV